MIIKTNLIQKRRNNYKMYNIFKYKYLIFKKKKM